MSVIDDTLSSIKLSYIAIAAAKKFQSLKKGNLSHSAI